jgi:PKD repeat protein
MGGGNTFQLFDVGLYEGPVAPAFQVPDYAFELALCQRYFEWVQITSPGYCPSTALGRTGIQFKVSKRISPTITAKNMGIVTINNPAGNQIGTSFAVNNNSVDSMYFDVNTSGLTLNAPCVINLGATNVYLNARL